MRKFKMVVKVDGKIFTIIESLSSTPIIDEVASMLSVMKKASNDEFTINIELRESDW